MASYIENMQILTTDAAYVYRILMAQVVMCVTLYCDNEYCKQKYKCF